MNFLQRINNSIEVKALPIHIGYSSTLPAYYPIGNDITLYSQDDGQRYLSKGYNLNDAVYSIVSKNAEKAGQIRLYHSKVKKTERKTLHEYNELSKGAINNKILQELTIMKKAMVEDLIVDSPLTKLLNKPNRFQTQSEWIEQLFGLRELQGEGNVWFNRLNGGKILEMMVIPRSQINLIGDRRDPWSILGYEFKLDGKNYRWEKEDVIMWKYFNPRNIDTNLEHLRGLAPLQSIMVLVQAMNEGDVRLATANKNAGASGLAYRTDLTQPPTAPQIEDMRNQFNSTINNSDMANKIAILGGTWGYLNIGKTMQELQLLEQYGISFKRLCRIFKTPPGIFSEGNDTFDNQKQYERHWIYSKIAPNIYNLRGMLSDRLLPEFGLDPETNLIDCDVMSLPEMTQDLAEMATGLKDIHGLTVDDRLKYFGFEPIGGPAGELRLVPTGLQTLEELAAPPPESLDEEESLLG
jgi:HK97 family phage portal protein